MPPVFEIPVFSAAAAAVVVDHGATRLEINRAGSYVAGGLTPTLAEVESISKAVCVPLRVMIRPRGPPSSGEPDFLYSDTEFQQMCHELDAFVASGLLQPARGDGFVFGILKSDRDGHLSVDVDRNRQLVQAAGPYACVIHRAFDLVLGDGGEAAVKEALRVLHECGCTGVLTAGGPGSRGAIEHAGTLQKLVATGRAANASSKHIEIVIGGGVRSSNVGLLAGKVLTGSCSASSSSLVAFHSSCLADAAAAINHGAEGESVSGDEVAQIRDVLASLNV
ncbi:hypothetical protein SEUCBS139899_006244 [Sporothrix eucalyptigena]|uniref:Copper homeostasis protein cutC homolog n=1 Tax=Sporothrix eucalyptigena TaxID=1812306 RepID=A0ABP0ASH8_9PEZI